MPFKHIPKEILVAAKQHRKNLTKAEMNLWDRLRNRQLGGYRFRCQKPRDIFIFDFYCAKCKLVIEVDGSSHIGREEHDYYRTERINEGGLTVIRFTNDDVEKRIEEVLEIILNKCKELESTLNNVKMSE